MIRSMLTRSSGSARQVLRRGYAYESVVPERNVTVSGATGGIGQPLSFLTKLNPLVSNLAMDDIANTPGVSPDVSRTNCRSEARAHMMSNPVASEVASKAGTYGDRRLFGATMLDLVRTKTFYAGKGVNVPVGGARAGVTSLPLFSQRTQDGWTNVMEAKSRQAYTLSNANSGALPSLPSKVTIGKNGAKESMDLKIPSVLETQGLLYAAPPLLYLLEKELYSFWEEISLDYVHQEMTRTFMLVGLRLFLLIFIKDLFLFLWGF